MKRGENSGTTKRKKPPKGKSEKGWGEKKNCKQFAANELLRAEGASRLRSLEVKKKIRKFLEAGELGSSQERKKKSSFLKGGGRGGST